MNPNVPPGNDSSGTGNSRPRKLHSKARQEKPGEYPDRFFVPDEKVSWNEEFPDYAPPYYVSPVVLANDCTTNPNGWADPEDISMLPVVPGESFEGVLHHDKAGRPLNPIGRTGIAGRGLLGKWGPNYAADPIITRKNRDSETIEMLAIQRKDNGQWAIPGGMVDKGEEVSRTLSRELLEETGVNLDMSRGNLIYRGYVDDRRNTDHAWMETTAKHLHLPVELSEKMNLLAGDDAKAVKWLQLTPQTVHNLYASHCSLIMATLETMIKNNQFSLCSDEVNALEILLKSCARDNKS